MNEHKMSGPPKLSHLTGRFNYLESKTLAQGRDLKDMTLAEMDAIWEEAKRREKE